ncbi:hypothetical protein [Flavobacterium sp. MK4S-17]|uniref:hypothetical protein n=1 Tax=Flavobacterium sp. MK4S-17 TaxID=2543737 RepID=UPI00135A483E|nr:hypothetical protein [Flavobacterium sp. MK4S-17]
MEKNRKTNTETTQANDDVSHNAHYEGKDKPAQFDERDQNKSADDWNAEQSRTGRHK